MSGERGPWMGYLTKPKEQQKVSCPCCEHFTLRERGWFEMCSECGWEDDGQDDADADVVRGGPNRSLSWRRPARFTEIGSASQRRSCLSWTFPELQLGFEQGGGDSGPLRFLVANQSRPPVRCQLRKQPFRQIQDGLSLGNQQLPIHRLRSSAPLLYSPQSTHQTSP